MADFTPTRTPGDQVTVRGRRGTLLGFNHHLDFWRVRYDDEPGVYYHVAENSMDEERNDG